MKENKNNKAGRIGTLYKILQRREKRAREGTGGNITLHRGKRQQQLNGKR